MLRSFFAGTALATTILVVLPFAAASNAEPGSSQASGGAAAPVISIAEADASDVSRLALAELVQRRVGVDPDAVDDAIDRRRDVAAERRRTRLQEGDDGLAVDEDVLRHRARGPDHRAAADEGCRHRSSWVLSPPLAARRQGLVVAV